MGQYVVSIPTQMNCATDVGPFLLDCGALSVESILQHWLLLCGMCLTEIIGSRYVETDTLPQWITIRKN